MEGKLEQLLKDYQWDTMKSVYLDKAINLNRDIK